MPVSGENMHYKSHLVVVKKEKTTVNCDYNKECEECPAMDVHMYIHSRALFAT